MGPLLCSVVRYMDLFNVDQNMDDIISTDLKPPLVKELSLGQRTAPLFLFSKFDS